MSDAKKDLEPIPDPRVIARYMQFILDFKEPIHCLMEEKKIAFDCIATDVDKSNLTWTIEPKAQAPAPETIWEENQKSVNRSVSLQFTTNDILFFAKGLINRPSITELTLKVLPPIEKLQRRAALRFRVAEDMNCTVKMAKRTFPVYDLSAGGFGVIIPKEDRELFKKGNKYSNTILSFRKRNHTVSVECAGISQEKGLDGKFGFHFTEISNTFESELAREAYWFHQKIWGPRI